MILYSETPQNNNRTANTPQFQDWAPLPNPNYSDYIYYPNSGAVIVPEQVVFFIKDSLGVSFWSQFTSKRLIAYQSYGTNNPVHWLEDDCFIGQGYPNSPTAPMAISESGLSYEFTPEFKNLNLLPVGVYSFVHVFIVQGLLNGTWFNLTSYQHYTRLTISNVPVVFSPMNFIFNHTIGTAMPSQLINMQGLSWKVFGNPKVVLTTSDSGTTITEITDSSGTYQTASGTGTGTFSITLSDFYDNDGDYDPLLLTQSLHVMSGTNLSVGYIRFTINLFQTPGLNVDPNALTFRAVRGINEADPQNVEVKSSAPITITSSIWLTCVETTIIEFGITKKIIIVTPIPSANFNLGTYNGTIEVTATISGVPVTRIINVTYIIEELIGSPYPGNKAFTLDAKYFTLSSSNPDSYIEVVADITRYDFFTDLPKTVSIKQKFVLYKNQSKFEIGATIHRLMSKFAEVNEAVLQYKPAILKLTCSEKENLTDMTLRSITVPDIEFVAGLTNECSGIIDYNPKPNRITKNAFAYLNLLLPAGNFQLRIVRNAEPEVLIDLPFSDGKLMTQKVTFENYNQGDIIKFSIKDINNVANLQAYEKIYKVMPEGKFSNTIVWENEFLLQTPLECTGDYKLPIEFESKTQELWQNLVQVLEILDVSRTVKFTINTGWLLMSDIDSVISLMEAKRAWLVQSGKNISLRPIGKSIVKEDSTRGLIEYTLEFQINQSHGKETYSF